MADSIYRFRGKEVKARPVVWLPCTRCDRKVYVRLDRPKPDPIVCSLCRDKETLLRNQARHKQRVVEVNGGLTHPKGLPSVTVGALNELRVCADLMSRGVHVFRALSPGCPCDLIAMVGLSVYRIECKSCYRNPNGSVRRPIHGHPDGFDVMACVLPDGAIFYFPDPFMPNPEAGKKIL